MISSLCTFRGNLRLKQHPVRRFLQSCAKLFLGSRKLELTRSGTSYIWNSKISLSIKKQSTILGAFPEGPEVRQQLQSGYVIGPGTTWFTEELERRDRAIGDMDTWPQIISPNIDLWASLCKSLLISSAVWSPKNSFPGETEGHSPHHRPEVRRLFLSRTLSLQGMLPLSPLTPFSSSFRNKRVPQFQAIHLMPPRTSSFTLAESHILEGRQN